MHHKAKKQRAFSLLELSIVLSIIGIILGSTLTIVNLSYKQRINNFMSEIASIAKMVNSFENKYDAMPGDYSGATTAFRSNYTKVQNGNGNGYIDGNEGVYAWGHLFYSELNQFKSDCTVSNCWLGSLLQPSVMPGGKYYFTSNISAAGSNVAMTLVAEAITDADTASNARGLLNVVDMRYMDAKFDDGDPSTGDIRAINGKIGGVLAACVQSDSPTQYNTLNNDKKACILNFIVKQNKY